MCAKAVTEMDLEFMRAADRKFASLDYSFRGELASVEKLRMAVLHGDNTSLLAVLPTLQRLRKLRLGCIARWSESATLLGRLRPRCPPTLSCLHACVQSRWP